MSFLRQKKKKEWQMYHPEGIACPRGVKCILAPFNHLLYLNSGALASLLGYLT